MDGDVSDPFGVSPLPEDGPVADIHAFFAERDVEIVVHQEAPPEPSDDERRRMSTAERRARQQIKWSHWADLLRIGSSKPLRWYGGGMNAEEAIRSARSRWRAEQGDAL